MGYSFSKLRGIIVCVTLSFSLASAVTPVVPMASAQTYGQEINHPDSNYNRQRQVDQGRERANDSSSCGFFCKALITAAAIAAAAAIASSQDKE